MKIKIQGIIKRLEPTHEIIFGFIPKTNYIVNFYRLTGEVYTDVPPVDGVFFRLGEKEPGLEHGIYLTGKLFALAKEDNLADSWINTEDENTMYLMPDGNFWIMNDPAFEFFKESPLFKLELLK